MKSSASFPKAGRLRRSGEFRSVLTKGKAVRENGLALYFVHHGAGKISEGAVAKSAESRLGILVSKRVAKRAVDRNTIKRGAREYFRVAKNRLRGGFDIVIRAIPSGKHPEKKELREILNRLFERAGLLAQNDE